MSVDVSTWRHRPGSDRSLAAPASGLGGWWFTPIPIARIAVLRVIVYLFVPVDVALSQSWVRGHARVGSDLYRPLRIAQLTHLPVPTSTSVTALAVVLVVAALIAAPGRAPRTTGTIVAVLYLAWMLVAMSYGKVDHDRVAFLVTLAVLPTVGPAARRDATPDARAGWAFRCIQIAIVLTYFYAAWAKIRFGGLDWPTGATLERALLRRATPLSHWMIDEPRILVPMQFAMIAGELLSPLILLARRDRARVAVAFGLWGFHLTVFAGVTIIFLPHCIAICAFLPWERLTARTHRGASVPGSSEQAGDGAVTAPSPTPRSRVD